MQKNYETPESVVERQYELADIARCSGGPIILPDDDFNP